MIALNKDFVDGISELECEENMDKLLNKILNYELELYKNKNNTTSKIQEQYREFIENFSEEE